ncbi:reverse transcriptase [Penicillium taxi]|uniref:reverse transcriptase n=1 Tax=Penicillium taxi TaxID=168475 RepID=UPI0025453C89|nr:reverse transcriptase [Penicillium taxi]KAJ5908735.1 reverse transcriptase [Penicillium taxi]
MIHTSIASIPIEKLENFEKCLRNKLDVYSRKLELADLYSRLLTEWINSSSEEAAEPAEILTDQDTLEGQRLRLEKLCDKFERAVFEPYQTDRVEIDSFLDDIFQTEQAKSSLDRLRDDLRRGLTCIWNQEDPFDIDTLSNCIQALKRSDVITEEKRETLKYFLNNNVALAEIADVLNMRYADLKNWDWNVGVDGIPVLPRQQLNGKYRICMDDDFLQMIFMEYICVQICDTLKDALKRFMTGSWWKFKQGPQMMDRDTIRRKYFVGPAEEYTVEELRENDFQSTFFMSSLPDNSTEHGFGYDEDEETFEGKSVRQELLRKVATETFFRHQFHGEAAILQTDFQWFGTSMPHSTIYAILEFTGFPQEWIELLQKYLEAPLNMDQSFEGHEKVGPRKRGRGIPIGHTSAKLIGELVLFIMDFAVNQKTGLLLYRLHDDIWLTGSPEKCAQAWEVMQEFAKLMGLEFNRNKSGSVCLGDSVDVQVRSRMPLGPVKVGFLMLNTEGMWVIVQSQVDAHIQQLKLQLESCQSVISWVRTWNSCIGRFFKSTFGTPAWCFGRPHVDAILETYKKMYGVIFETGDCKTGGTITKHLKNMIELKFGLSEIPDAFFFLPEKLGGLNLRNPFISIFRFRDDLDSSPDAYMKGSLIHERKSYISAASDFEKMSANARRRRWESLEEDHEPTELTEAFLHTDKEKFISFDEWSKFRESTSSKLADLYLQFMRVPLCGLKKPRSDQNFRTTLQSVRSEFGLRNTAELHWTLAFFADSLLANFGGLNLVDKQFLPIGVLEMIKEKKVSWQMVL